MYSFILVSSFFTTLLTLTVFSVVSGGVLHCMEGHFDEAEQIIPIACRDPLPFKVRIL